MGWEALNALLTLVLGIPLIGAAELTGKQEELCARMGGTYMQQATYPQDVCPGGRFINLVYRKFP